jgi:hypothetical protein
MGLLDDAIREHLDLKRRRGADPAEVERAEREALGPVRRVAEGQDVPDLEFEPARRAEPEYEQTAESEYERVAEPEYEYAESPLEFEDDFDEDSEQLDPHAEDAPPPTPVAAEPVAPEPPAEPAGKAPAAADVEPPPSPPEPGYEYAGEETVEYDVEEALEAEQAEAGEDVLEETPEFLQDTPDHDRLWFEQKPPRDFDFDG